jgi:thermostable 8-oxoguanine DNA glycosylase
VGKKCEICNKRKSKYPVVVQVTTNSESILEMCWACHSRYLKLRRKYLVKAFEELLDIHQKVEVL